MMNRIFSYQLMYQLLEVADPQQRRQWSASSPVAHSDQRKENVNMIAWMPLTQGQNIIVSRELYIGDI
jgi:hypothetical protein